MTTLTADQIEEARYEMWVEAGGPAKAQAEQVAAANRSLAEIEAKGYRILSTEMVRETADYAVVEAIVRKGDTLTIIRWKPFNQGWMSKSVGWTIWTA
jgi:hypothetical protein